jgi:hypothetical protein
LGGKKAKYAPSVGSSDDLFSSSTPHADDIRRVSINTSQLQRFSLGEASDPLPPKPVAGTSELEPMSRRHITYNLIDPKILQEIGSIESMGSYGSKIQTLVRHLLHVQLADPGAKRYVHKLGPQVVELVAQPLPQVSSSLLGRIRCTVSEALFSSQL